MKEIHEVVKYCGRLLRMTDMLLRRSIDCANYRAALRPIKIGHLRLVEEHSREFRRTIVYAILHGPAGAEVIPRLHDAVVRHIADGYMTISGLERDDLTGACRGQSWFVQVHVDTPMNTRGRQVAQNETTENGQE